jgi:hypothetical protein
LADFFNNQIYLYLQNCVRAEAIVGARPQKADSDLPQTGRFDFACLPAIF